MKIKVNITGVQPLKSGVNPKTQKPWTLFKYTCDAIKVDGDAYTSFTSFTGHENGPTELDLEVNVNGQWKNLREAAVQSALGKKLADLEKRVAALEKASKPISYDEVPVVEETNDVDY